MHRVHFYVGIIKVFLIGGAVSCGDTSTLELSAKGLIQPSTHSVAELMATPPSQLSQADRDRLSLAAGTLSASTFVEKYDIQQLDPLQNRSLLDDLADAVWGGWERVEIPGAVCGDGSPYRIFVSRSTGFWNRLLGYSSRLLVYLEPGGACWDYEGCTGQARRGAANPNGIPDNHMNVGDFLDPNIEGGSVNAIISPLVLRNNPTGDNVETSRWNKVFIPYCTGDVHSGNRVAVYEDPTGQNPPLTYRHVGAKNIEKVIEYLRNEFYRPREMMVAGCSAGGTGALANYAFFRDTLDPRTSHLLNDSGPIFPATPFDGNQFPLHENIRANWNVEETTERIAQITGVPRNGDLGQVNEAIAQRWPNDRIGLTMFKRDANYSVYSYASFNELNEDIPEDKEQILQLWSEDIDRLKVQYDTRSNLSYFIPYLRSVNESHCTTVIEWTGTEIENTGIDVGGYIEDILDGGSVTNYEEPDNPSDINVTNFWLNLVNFALE